MSIGYLRGLRVLGRAFRNLPAGDRVHILGRYLTCPFTRVLDEFPHDARVLEIGSGHGLFALLIAENGAREVIGVDPDLRKSLLPSPSPRVRKIGGYDECVRGTFDAVAICDVAYRLPLDVQRALFARVLDRLRPGGVLVLKEMDSGHRWKMKWARFQEWLADSFLHLTHGEGFVYESRDDVRALLEGAGFVGFSARAVDFAYPHPHIVYTARKPQ
ncbi:MAG: class I SAM-dependent methyltransferase [Thermoanaerobaculia bacterium]